MQNIASTAAVVGVVISVVAVFANKERVSHSADGIRFQIERAIIYSALLVSVIMSALSIYWVLRAPSDVNHESDALVPLVVGILSALCSIVWSLYEVRLGESSLHFGILGRRRLAYSSIVEIRDIRNQGSPRVVVRTDSGKLIGLWSNLLGYESLIDGLRSSSDAAYTRIERTVGRF